MSLRTLFAREGYWLGPFAAVYAWVVILACAALNPWWSVTAKALSYMGASTANDPWLYDYVGMVPTGLMLLVFSIYLTTESRNRSEVVGSLMFFLAGALLVGIGVFHQGPGWYPVGTARDGQNLHDLFSAWFFLQLFLTVIFWGIGLRREGERPLGNSMLLLAFGAIAVALGILAAFRTIPGGTGEVLGILAIDIWVALMYFVRARHLDRSSSPGLERSRSVPSVPPLGEGTP
jgi:hypothetical membrane protein